MAKVIVTLIGTWEDADETKDLVLEIPMDTTMDKILVKVIPSDIGGTLQVLILSHGVGDKISSKKSAALPVSTKKFVKWASGSATTGSSPAPLTKVKKIVIEA
jgi:hypothetical protein